MSEISRNMEVLYSLLLMDGMKVRSTELEIKEHTQLRVTLDDPRAIDGFWSIILSSDGGPNIFFHSHLNPEKQKFIPFSRPKKMNVGWSHWTKLK